MPWACKIGEKSIRLEDIEIGILGDIARQFEIDWITLINVPALDDRAARALITKCAELLGEPPPEKFTARTLLDAFETADEDLPETVDEGGLPLEEEAKKTES